MVPFNLARFSLLGVPSIPVKPPALPVVLTSKIVVYFLANIEYNISKKEVIT